MTSVVVMSVVAPFQLGPALMPNRLYELVPSEFLISLRPQPVSWAAWAIMNLAGMPVAFSAAAAASVCAWMKLAAAFCGSATGASGCSGSTGDGLADTGFDVTPC